jgi:putative transposase
MAESFVKTIKHDYIAFMEKPDVPPAFSHLAGAFEHYNERRPHKALKYRSPREFRRTAASSTQRCQSVLSYRVNSNAAYPHE